jgi:hypothetical protein
MQGKLGAMLHLHNIGDMVSVASQTTRLERVTRRPTMEQITGPAMTRGGFLGLRRDRTK